MFKYQKNYLLIIGISLFASIFTSCASNKHLHNPKDPFEPINRGVYQFNKTLDALYINPINQVYIKTIPQPLKQLVGNFFNNILEIPTIINNLLQLKFEQARNSTARFIINTTLGIGGLFDMADKANLKSKKEDLGNTLYNWGYINSNFVMLPIIGPSTVRDSIGLIGNTFISVPYYFKPKWRNRYQGSYMIHRRSELEELQSLLKTVGVDEYAMLRDSYLQNRDYQLNLKNKDQSIQLDAPPE